MKNSFLKKVLSATAAAAIWVSSFSAFAVSSYAAEVQGVPEIPAGAIVVNDITVKTTSAGTWKDVVVDSNGTKRNVAYTNQNDGIWYLGDYDLGEIESIDVRGALVPDINKETGEVTSMPEIRFAYMPIAAGDVVNTEYVTSNSKTIRNTSGSTSKEVARITGTTLLNTDYQDGKLTNTNGHTSLGAMFHIDANGVSVDAAEYAAYPGGAAKVDAASKKLDTSKGRVHLFVYGQASSRRVTIDYIAINMKQYDKFDLSGSVASKWSEASQSHNNGETYTYTTNKFETADASVSNLYDGKIVTTFKPGTKHMHLIDLGKEILVDKLVVKANTGGQMIYGLAKANEFTEKTVTSTNWFRAQDTLGTMKIDSNYGITLNKTEEDATAYWEFTLKATGKPQAYRYLIVDDNNNKDVVCHELELYTLKRDFAENAFTVAPYTGTADGDTHDAVAVTGIQEGDTVSYQLDDGEASGEIPQITEAGTYQVKVTIKRYGYKTYTKTITAVIAAKEPVITITDISSNDAQITAKVQVENATEGMDGRPIAAYYANGACQQVQFVGAGGSVAFDKVSGGYIKALYWKDLESIKPILAEATAEITDAQ